MIVLLVLAAGAAWESPVLEQVSGRPGLVVLKRCVDVDDLLAAGTAGQADVALVTLDAPGLDTAAVDLLHHHQVRVVAVAGSGSAEEAQLRARRVGVDALGDAGDLHGLLDLLEPADLPAAPSVPTDTPEGVAPDAPSPQPSPAAPGRVVVVWGPAGAPGRTMLATGLATSLAERGLRTTLVDADPHAPSVTQQLGILDEVSGLLSAARLTSEGALEERFGSVQRALGERLTVVTGLPRPERWIEVRAGVVHHLLEVARTHGQVVVDVGFSLEDDPASDLTTRPGRNQLTLGSLEVADEILVVGSAEPVGLTRLARGLVELRELWPGKPIRVVVNRMRGSLGWSERDIAGMVEGFARLTSIHFLPDDPAAADRSVLAGVALTDLGDTELGRAVAAIGSALVPSTSPHRDQRSRWVPTRSVRWRRAGRARRR